MVRQGGNLGDESYKLTFPKLFPQYDFTFVNKITGEPEIVILGGGDVLYQSFINQIKKCKTDKIYAASVNLRDEDIDLSSFKKIIARNFVDTSKYKNVYCYPDFAFKLEANKARGKAIVKKLFTRHKLDLYQNLVIVVMNSFLCVRETILARDYIAFEKICFDLAKLTDNVPASFLFLPFGNGFPQNDRISNSFVYSNCKFWKKNLLLFEQLGIQDSLDIFAAADAAITTRLHGGIFSCIGETPFIDITHHTKTKLFLDWIGKPEWSVDFWNFEYHKTKKLLEDFLLNKEFYRDEVHKINVSSKKLLSQMDFDFTS